MKKITFTTAGIAILILLQLSVIGFMFFGRHKGGHHARSHGDKAQACPASFKEHGRGGHHGRGPQHHGAGGLLFLEDLNLTAEQKTKIDALKKEHFKTEEANRAKHRELKEKQFQLLQRETLDQAQVDALATQSGQLKKEEVLSRMAFYHSVQQVLTKEQKEQLKQRMERRPEHRSGEQPPIEE